jgi:hypothetical protein
MKPEYNPNPNTHIHTHSHIHTYIHTYTYTHINTFIKIHRVMKAIHVTESTGNMLSIMRRKRSP